MLRNTILNMNVYGLVAFLPLVLGTLLPAQTPDRDHLQDNVFGQIPWRELGPVSPGGRITAIAVHPQRSSVFWVAAASGGIWKTTNAGISFEPQFQDAYSISIGDLAVAPSDGNVLYVGTGEGNNQRSSYWGNGVHRSADGGKTWQHVGLDGTDHIGRIAIHPNDPNTVYVAALGALYSSNDARGLYKTTDGGKSWQRIWHQGPTIGCVDVALDPKRPDTVYAASYERHRSAWNFREGGPGSRLWKSSDGGQQWQQLGGGLPDGDLGRIGLCIFPANPRILYSTIENLNPAAPVAEAAATAADNRRPRARTRGGEVYRSEDGGDTWTKQNGSQDIGGSPGYYYGQIRVDPRDDQTIYVLSVQVFRSRDGGRSWTPGRNGSDSYARTLHSDHHALWLDPKDGSHALLGNDGGLAVTWDGGRHWDHLAHLPITQFYTIAVDQRSPYHIYGGLQDNGTVVFPSQAATSGGIQAADTARINGGDGFYVCIDPNDPDVVYSESQFGGMSRQNLRTGERRSIKPVARRGDAPLRFNWQTPILLSPHAPHTVYTGSQYLHRSRDRGDTWTTISGDLSSNDAEKKRGNVPHCTITTIAESPRREGWLWVGTDDGRVWTSKDGGQRWVELTERFPAFVQGLWVSRIEASPHQAETAFVSFTGYRKDLRSPYLYRTDDGGETWLAIDQELPLEPINVVRQHPRQANVLFVGTEMGAYVSVDDGAQWFRLGRAAKEAQGLPRVAVHDLVVHPREPHVVVGTHGRGVFALDASAFEGLQVAQLARNFQALPPSHGSVLPRAFSRGNVGARSWSAANPFVQATFRYVLASDSAAKVTLQVKDATGRVLWSQDGPTRAGYHEVAWQAPRGGRPQGGAPQGGAPQGGGRAGMAAGQRPGQFAVTIQCGDEQATFPFTVHDLRGPSGGLGSGAGDDEVGGDR